jgi:hypothetical protein
MTYSVKDWGSDVRNAETRFFPMVADCLEQLNNGNSTDLAGERLKFATPLKRILNHALEGVEIKFDVKKKAGVRIKVGDNGGASTDRIQALRNLGKATIASKAFKDAFPTPEKVAKEKDLQAWAERAIKSNGADKLEAMIAALQAQRNTVKAAA